MFFKSISLRSDLQTIQLTSCAHWQLISSPTPIPRQPLIYFLSLWICLFLDTLYKWNLIICALSWLDSFTKHNVSDLCCFCCQMVSRCFTFLTSVHCVSAPGVAAAFITSYRWGNWGTVTNLKGNDSYPRSLTSEFLLLDPFYYTAFSWL